MADSPTGCQEGIAETRHRGMSAKGWSAFTTARHPMWRNRPPFKTASKRKNGSIVPRLPVTGPARRMDNALEASANEQASSYIPLMFVPDAIVKKSFTNNVIQRKFN